MLWFVCLPGALVHMALVSRITSPGQRVARVRSLMTSALTPAPFFLLFLVDPERVAAATCMTLIGIGIVFAAVMRLPEADGSAT